MRRLMRRKFPGFVLALLAGLLGYVIPAQGAAASTAVLRAPVRAIALAAAWHREITITLTRAATAAAPARTYVVRPGDSLFAIALRLCGTGNDWLGLWHATRGIPDPDLIGVGLVVAVACNASGPGYAPVAPAYQAPAADGDGDHDGDMSGAPAQQAQQQQQPSYQAQPASTYQGSGGMQQCIIARESGGNSQVMNSTGHYGLYQFSYSTWVAHGGNPGDFGNASVAEQNQVYYATVAADGYSDWAPYDGC